MRRVAAEISEGLRHGYFDLTIDCEIVSHGRRQLTIHAGKSYRFLISEAECVQEATSDTKAPASIAQPRCIVETTSSRSVPLIERELPVAHGEQS